MPNRYGVNLFPPSKKMGGGSSLQNPFQSVRQSPQGSDARGVGLRCESVTLPYKPLNHTGLKHLWSTRYRRWCNICRGMQCPLHRSDLEERVFFENGRQLSAANWNVDTTTII